MRTYFGAAAAICIAMSLPSCWKASVFATKSVSQLISTRTPIFPPMWMYDVTIPSEAILDCFFAAAAIPFSRSQIAAFSKSPSDSTNAFLQSIIPAFVLALSSATSFAVKFIILISFYFFIFQIYFQFLSLLGLFLLPLLLFSLQPFS